MEKIILASASPRRSEILKAVGMPFEVVCSDADESSVTKDCGARLYVQELALLKASAVAKTLVGKKNLIVAADTVVVSEGEILGKPADEQLVGIILVDAFQDPRHCIGFIFSRFSVSRLLDKIHKFEKSVVRHRITL